VTKKSIVLLLPQVSSAKHCNRLDPIVVGLSVHHKIKPVMMRFSPNGNPKTLVFWRCKDVMESWRASPHKTVFYRYPQSTISKIGKNEYCDSKIKCCIIWWQSGSKKGQIFTFLSFCTCCVKPVMATCAIMPHILQPQSS